MKNEHVLLGGRGINSDRIVRDFYPTPRWGTLALLDFIELRDVVWEPACGDGAMARVLGENHRTVATDIMPRKRYGTKADFLTAPLPRRVKSIITNPPFYLGREFIARILYHRPRIELAALLLRFTVLAGNMAWVNTIRQSHPTKIIALQHRLPYRKNGVWVPGVFSHVWIVWTRDIFEVPTFHWSTRRGEE